MRGVEGLEGLSPRSDLAMGCNQESRNTRSSWPFSSQSTSTAMPDVHATETDLSLGHIAVALHLASARTIPPTWVRMADFASCGNVLRPARRNRRADETAHTFVVLGAVLAEFLLVATAAVNERKKNKGDYRGPTSGLPELSRCGSHSSIMHEAGVRGERKVGSSQLPPVCGASS
jgi:hypothetical protein